METTEPPPAAAPPSDDGGPRVSGTQMRDISQLRRSGQDRTIAGVAGGLARHFDIDPTVVRVLFVVLALFGGAGVLLYAALWLLVPADGEDRSLVGASGDVQRTLVIGAAAVAALIVLGQGWGGWGVGSWWVGPPAVVVVLVVLGVALLAGRDRREPTVGDQSAAAFAAGTPTADAPAAPVAQTRPAWAPPPYRPRARRPRRTGVVLFWPTLGLIAVALGSLGLYDAGHHVAQGAYPALALAVIGLMLVVGAFKGRAGGLVLLGVLAALTLAASSAAGGFHRGVSTTYTPLTGSEVRSAYSFHSGSLTLDLAQVGDLAALNGREISIDGGAGVIEVIVPRGVRVEVEHTNTIVGGFQVGDRQGGGVDLDGETTLSAPAGAPTLDLDLTLRVGQITVRHPQ